MAISRSAVPTRAVGVMLALLSGACGRVLRGPVPSAICQTDRGANIETKQHEPELR